MSQDDWFLLFVVGITGWVSPRAGFFFLTVAATVTLYTLYLRTHT
jgi:hypothetical protein